MGGAMAGDNTFPQLPGTVWKGVWGIFRKSATRKLDENVLAAELNVQTTAARQYINELGRLNIIDGNGSPTDLAARWRQDGDDPEIILEILKGAYPSALLELAPPDSLDRDKIVRWFLGQNLGEGAAKNKAATYMRIAAGVSAAEPAKQQNGSSEQAAVRRKGAAKPRANPVQPIAKQDQEPPLRRAEKPDLNINIQIHISADASAEQIDAIFAGMKKYFD